MTSLTCGAQVAARRPSRSTSCRSALVAVTLAGVVAAGSAQATVISQWNWNTSTTATIGVPTTGTTGVYAGVLTTGALLASSSGPTGSLTDPLGADALNKGVLAGSYPAATDPSGTDGIGVTGVDTAGAAQVGISWAMKVGANASRYWQLFATADGTTWNPVSGGVGAVTAIGVGDQAPSAATISDSGLIAITANPAAYTNSNPSGYASFAYKLPTGQGYEGSAAFGFRLLSVWDPNGSSYVAASPTGVYAGTGSFTAAMFDMVTVSAVPEPGTSCLAAMGCGWAACVMRRSRRR